MAKVKIQGNASGTGVLTLTAPNTDTDRTITLPDGDVTMGVGIDDNATSTAMTIDSSGRVMIGTTTEGDVNGDDLTIATTGSSGITVRSGTGSDGHLFFSDGTSSADEYRGYIQYNHQNNRFVFGTDATERMRIHSNGVTSIPSGVALGVGTANTASNVLDDYEEGTWTPGFGGATISAGHTTGYYTKIGRQVFLIWYSAELQISSASGGAEINGLPFTASSVTNANSLFSYQHGTAIDGGSTGGYIQRATTKMHFVDTNGTAKASYINGTRYIMIAGTYFTD